MSLLTENCLDVRMLDCCRLLSLSVVTGVCTEIVLLMKINILNILNIYNVKTDSDLFDETGVAAGLTSLMPHSTSKPDLRKIF